MLTKLCFFFFSIALYSQSDCFVPKQLLKIPPHERAEIEDFFRSLFVSGDFAFAILGVKPLGATDYNLTLALRARDKAFTRRALLSLRGRQKWEQYAHLFPFTHFSLITYDTVEDNSCYGALLINNGRCRDIIEKHRRLFDKLYGDQASAEEILSRICKGAKGSRDRVSFFEGVGLLFGYPQESIGEFVLRHQLYATLSSLPLDLSQGHAEVIRRMDKTADQRILVDASSALKKLISLEQKYGFNRCVQANPLFPIRVPGYMSSEHCDNSQYEDVIPQVMSLSASPTFLEEILRILSL